MILKMSGWRTFFAAPDPPLAPAAWLDMLDAVFELTVDLTSSSSLVAPSMNASKSYAPSSSRSCSKVPEGIGKRQGSAAGLTGQ